MAPLALAESDDRPDRRRREAVKVRDELVVTHFQVCQLRWPGVCFAIGPSHGFVRVNDGCELALFLRALGAACELASTPHEQSVQCVQCVCCSV